MLEFGQSKIPELLFDRSRFTILDLTTLMSKTNNAEDLSTLYTNRGALYYDHGNFEWALNDLNKAIEYNHLNYAAYFNIFTVLSQLSKDEQSNFGLEGLKNLCCSLSCLYLLRGKNKNNETDVSKCVKLAENNCEGRLLRALQYTKKQKYILALNELKWVLDLEPSNLDILQIKSFIKSKLKGSDKGRYDQLQQQDQNQDEEGTSQVQDNGKRLKCALYDEALQDQNFSLEQQISSRLSQFQSVFKEVFGPKLYEIKMQKRNNKFITLMDIQNINQTETKAEQQNVNVRILLRQQKQKNEDDCLIENQLVQSSGFGVESGLNAYLRSSNNKNSERQSFEGSSNSFLTVKALDDENKRINIKVGKIRIIQKQQQQISHNNLYCSFEFGQPKLQLIKSTPQSGLYQQTAKSEDEEETRMLKVKVFSKQILSFNDKFVGKGQEEIKGPGKYDIVLYNNTNNEIQDVGYVEIYIQYS